MSINKKISEFISVDGLDNTTQIPIVQGSPMFNGKITPEKFAEALGIGDLESHINADNPHNIDKNTIELGRVDNTSDLEKPISIATQEALDILDAKVPVMPMVTLTEAEYDNLSPKDPNTYYFIKEY